ncbi:MAG: methionine adenosyltransferase domain-containing protein, partial [Myxococcota bacterium]
VVAGLASRCEVQLAYAIGVAEPVSIMVETFGTGTVAEDEIVRAVRKEFSAKPAAIIERLDLLRPIYRQTASYGHFGRIEPAFTWERADAAERLAELAGHKAHKSPIKGAGRRKEALA